MKPSVDLSEESTVGMLVAYCVNGGYKRATKFFDPNRVLSVARRQKPDGRSKRVDLVLKIGAPNFRERVFIKSCQKAGEPFPVKKIQLKFFK
jgi:hypothetical protein